MVDRSWQRGTFCFWRLQISRHVCLQILGMKKYGKTNAVPGLLSLVQLELGMSPDVTSLKLRQAYEIFAGLCCAVLCCAVLCCAVLCCAVLCCAVLCCAVLCCAVLCCAVLCCAVLSD